MNDLVNSDNNPNSERDDMGHDNIIAECTKHNARLLRQDGPRLRYGYSIYVIARDREKKLVLLGGLGGMGTGEMWVADTPQEATRPGYEDAPEQANEEEDVLSWEALGGQIKELITEIEASPDAIIWMCKCSAWNSPNQDECPHCHQTKAEVLKEISEASERDDDEGA